MNLADTYYILFDDAMNTSKEELAALSIVDAIRLALRNKREEKPQITIGEKEVKHYLSNMYSMAEVMSMNTGIVKDKVFEVLSRRCHLPRKGITFTAVQEVKRGKVTSVIVVVHTKDVEAV